MPPNDLIKAVVRARRGLRQDVKLLVDAIAHESFFIPLTKSLADQAQGDQVVLKPDQIIATRLLPKEETGEKFVPLFTEPKILEPFQKAFGWKTEDGPLEYLGISGMEAFQFALKFIEDSRAAGIVINPFHPSGLELGPREVKSIAQGQPIPLVRYLEDLPLQPGEKFLSGKPSTPPPADLVKEVESFLAGRPQVLGYEFLQVFNPERDVEPHLLLNIRTRAKGTGMEFLRRKLLASLTVKPPPPGYMDVTFDMKF